jgi:hypothetical protein
MDYVFLDAMRHVKVKRHTGTYDVWCKYNINLDKRLSRYPEDLKKAYHEMERRGYVPKMHLGAHGEVCQTPWNLNYAIGVGRSDGEGPERGWADEGELATQVSEMGPGHRHATIDDAQGEGNYRRVVKMGASMLYPFVPPLLM